MRRSLIGFLWMCCFYVDGLRAEEIKTNEVIIANAPKWLKKTRVEKVTDRIQNKLEWSTRKVNVYWYETQANFEKVHNFGPQAKAITKFQDNGASIHAGPNVNDKNFDEIFGHELVHVIIFQKYKDAIPKWLEEGLANHLSNLGKVDYKWLARQPFPSDVLQLAHPFKGSADGVNYRYKASQALAEMLDKKCDLENLIRLSVERKMEKYISTYCEIKDINQAFKEWVQKKAI